LAGDTGSTFGSGDRCGAGLPTRSRTQLAGGSTVTVAGTNFVPGMTFVFGKTTVSGSNCISTSCTASTPAGKAGIVDVIAQVGKSKSKKSRPADTFIYR
jgi:hypothetical protein